MNSIEDSPLPQVQNPTERQASCVHGPGRGSRLSRRGSLPLSNLVLFGALLAAGAIPFGGIFLKVVELSVSSDVYSIIIGASAISAYLFWSLRHEIFAEIRCSIPWGAAAFCVCALVYVSVRVWFSGSADLPSLMWFCALIYLSGCFLVSFGSGAFRNAAFPFIFLLLTVPFPSTFLDPTVHFLQKWSFQCTCRLLKLAGLQFATNDNFELLFPTVTFEVAPQCSGIKSSLALAALSILLGFFHLRTFPARLSLLIAAVPICIFKNALRIFTIIVIYLFIDKSVIASPLHVSGGVIFFLIGLAMLYALALVLRKIERKLSGND